MASYENFNRNEIIAEINRIELSTAICKAKLKAYKDTKDSAIKEKLIEWEDIIELNQMDLEEAKSAWAVLTRVKSLKPMSSAHFQK